MSGRPLIVQQICGHAVQPEFDGAPLGHHTVQNPIKGGAVIMLQKVGHFMEQDVIHTFARRFDESRVEHDRSIGHPSAHLWLPAEKSEPVECRACQKPCFTGCGCFNAGKGLSKRARQ